MTDYSGLAWMEVDLGAIVQNARAALHFAGAKNLIAVVKANGYGHGAVEVARALEGQSLVRAFAVSNIDEGLVLRAAGIGSEILVLGHISENDILSALAHDLTLSFNTMAMANLLIDSGHQFKSQIRLDLSGGFGLLAHEIGALMRLGDRALGKLGISGLYTHLYEGYHSGDGSVEKQLDRFDQARGVLEKHCSLDFVHVATTPMVMRGYGGRYDTIRIGNLLYGISPEVHGEGTEYPVRAFKSAFKPAMTICAKLVAIKEPRHEVAIDYLSSTSRICKRIGYVAIGYADGFFLFHQKGGQVLWGSRRLSIVGGVGMDMLAVDLSDCDARVGDTVTILEADHEGLNRDLISKKSPLLPKASIGMMHERLPIVYGGR